MIAGAMARLRLVVACGGVLGLSACTSSDWEGIAAGLQMAGDQMAVTMTQVPRYGCGLNAERRPVCDTTGDGFADRYGDPSREYVEGWNYGTPTRINDYGEAYQYNTNCSCWRREPSLDRRPR